MEVKQEILKIGRDSFLLVPCERKKTGKQCTERLDAEQMELLERSIDCNISILQHKIAHYEWMGKNRDDISPIGIVQGYLLTAQECREKLEKWKDIQQKWQKALKDKSRIFRVVPPKSPKTFSVAKKNMKQKD